MTSYSEKELPETQGAPAIGLPNERVSRAARRLPGRITLRPAPGSPSDARSKVGIPPPLPIGIGTGGYEAVKRASDITGAFLLLLLLFPLMLVIALLVSATSIGPALFRQTRLGRHGAHFALYKFRTMVSDAERQLDESPDLWRAFEASYKLARDPRVTPLGAFLRRTSLDELPQLFNILGGSMSLIGPRPIVPKEIVKYGDDGPKLLSVKPGLGGCWQAHGRSDTTYSERIALDMLYIDSRSLGTDLALLGKTALAVFRRRGSY